MHDFDTRYSRWLRRLEAHRLDGFLVSHPPNLSYLFNFNGSTGIACSLSGGSHLIVDSRYIEQAGSDSVNCQPILAEQSIEETLKTILSDAGQGQRIGVESRHLSYDFVLHMQSWHCNVELVPTSDLIEELRAVKDPAEIQTIRQAFRIAQQAYRQATETLRPGMRETEWAGILELELRKAGGEGPSFETIVASGPRSSLPHGLASSKRIESHEVVLVDFGTRYLGYCSDLTRVHLFPGVEEPEIYRIVLEAQNAALSTIKPGVLSSDVDAAARKVIADHGYGDRFGHSTGHGLGQEVHELPRISAKRPAEIQEGMVFTVEPGIYLPGQYGIRIEDAVVVTQTGYHLLSNRGA